MKPEEEVWDPVREKADMLQPPNNELQGIVDHMERSVYDDDFGDFDDFDDEY